MATKKAKKKEQIDVHPERVQNPFEKLKRSPGKFDQRVFKEQELMSSNVNKYYMKLYTTQHRVQMTSFDKQINELRNRSTELRAETEDFLYLKALRAALLREKEKRDRGEKIYIPPPVSPEPTRRIKPTPGRKTKLKKKIEQAGEKDQPESTNPEESAIAQVASNNLETVHTGPNQEEPEDDGRSESVLSESTVSTHHPRRKSYRTADRTKSANRLAKVENLSFEIMTHTMPINKLKRIMPDETLPVHERWPILSNYRKKKVMPSVLEGKQQLEADMGELHKKLNDYFQCDNFPLWQYKYIPKDHPRKYKLLKAIETGNIALPTIPK